VDKLPDHSSAASEGMIPSGDDYHSHGKPWPMKKDGLPNLKNGGSFHGKLAMS